MEILVKNIVLPFDAPQEYALRQAKQTLGQILCRDITSGGHIYKKSVDARKRSAIKFVYTASVDADFTAAELETLKSAGYETLIDEDYAPPKPGIEPLTARPVVVGFGPCGMFCALTLARSGYRPLVLERGSDVEARGAAVERFIKTGILDTETNVQFGAGGAGTFSDGKLVTRINDPACRYILKTLHSFGAPEEILTSAKPHIGTDRLRAVVAAVRDEIVRLGGEIVFGCKVERFISDSSGKVTAVECVDSENKTLSFECGTIVLATGHSARDVYAYLASDDFAFLTKPFSVGARIEHLRADIDRALFGDFAGDPRLGAGEYAFSKHWDNGAPNRADTLQHNDTLQRSDPLRCSEAVYTFCMCPGGEVIAAASEEGGVVTNGMSVMARNGVNSNAALVASVDPAPGKPLDAVEFQRNLERAAFASARGGEYYAPCQTVGDFIDGKSGTPPTRIKPSYRGGCVVMRDLCTILPRDVTGRMREGILAFDRSLRGFAARDALLTGVETRTSAPLRIIRGDDFTAPGHANVYPCGEGAGYAGGITSAAADGLHTAEKIIARYKPAGCEDAGIRLGR